MPLRPVKDINELEKIIEYQMNVIAEERELTDMDVRMTKVLMEGFKNGRLIITTDENKSLHWRVSGKGLFNTDSHVAGA